MNSSPKAKSFGWFLFRFIMLCFTSIPLLYTISIFTTTQQDTVIDLSYLLILPLVVPLNFGIFGALIFENKEITVSATVILMTYAIWYEIMKSPVSFVFPQVFILLLIYVASIIFSIIVMYPYGMNIRNYMLSAKSFDIAGNFMRTMYINSIKWSIGIVYLSAVTVIFVFSIYFPNIFGVRLHSVRAMYHSDNEYFQSIKETYFKRDLLLSELTVTNFVTRISTRETICNINNGSIYTDIFETRASHAITLKDNLGNNYLALTFPSQSNVFTENSNKVISYGQQDGKDIFGLAQKYDSTLRWIFVDKTKVVCSDIATSEQLDTLKKLSRLYRK